MLRRKRRALILLTSTATIAALVGGIAWAAIPEGNIVNACFATPGGSLRAVDVLDRLRHGRDGGRARRADTRATRSPTPATSSCPRPSVRVGSVDLVAGTYLVHGKVNISNQNFTALGATFVPCTLRLAGTTTNLDQTWMIIPSARTGLNASNASVSLQAAATVPADPGRRRSRCSAHPSPAGRPGNGRHRALPAAPGRPGGLAPGNVVARSSGGGSAPGDPPPDAT